MRKGTRHDLTACEGCRFLSKDLGWCNYSDLTGRTRLAQGAVLFDEGGCALKEIGPTKYRPRDLPVFGYKREQTFTQMRLNAVFKTMEILYEQGLSDAEIAAEVGKTKGAVHQWRKRGRRPANYEQGSGKKLRRDNHG